MEQQARVSATARKAYGPERSLGHGFDVEKRGSGSTANQWVPVLELIYKTESEAKKAQEVIGQTLNSVVHIEGIRDGF